MELIMVGLLGAVIYLGPEDFEKLITPHESQAQEQVVDAKTQSNSMNNPETLSSLSQQYDPLDPGAIYVAPEKDSLMVDESGQVEGSTVDQATAKIKQVGDKISEPVLNWYNSIKQENRARADRHTFVRNRSLY